MYKIKEKKNLLLPNISIIIPVKDQLLYLDKCLASLEKLQDILCEVIIVNDGSNAETVNYLNRFPQLNIIHSTQSEGFISACHKGAQKAIGKYLLFLNSDTELIEPKSFKYMVDCFNDRKVGVVGARLLLENNTIQHSSLIFDSKQMNYVHRHYGKDMNDPVVCVNETVDVVTGACFMTPRELWNKIGGFDRIFGMGYFEDTDYCLKVKELGLSTIYCGGALLYHYQSKSFSGGPTKEHFNNNWEIFKQRWIRTGKIVKYPKIAACYITKDSEEFIEYSIKSIYPMVSKIIVVDNCSKDRTIEILEKMEDPQKKLIVISREFKNKTEQRNVYCDMLQGMDYAFIIDGDEVWDGENLRKIEHLIFSNPLVPSFQFNFYDFWKDLAHISKGVWETFVGRKSLINLNICGKIKYDIHTLPILENGGDIPSIFVKDIYFFHYSYVRTDKQIKDKIDYYIKTGTPGFQQQPNWYEEVWLKWDIDKEEVEKTKGTHLFGGGWTELWFGNHPEVMKNHPRFLQYVDKYKLKVNMTVHPLQRDGFMNVCIQNHNVMDIKISIGDKKPYIVFIEDLLQKISYNAIGEMLVKIYDQMELDGEIIIKTLNLQEVLKRFVNGNLQYVDFVKLLYGEQKESFDYNSCCYDEAAIKALLEDVGFTLLTIDKIENGLFLYAIGRKIREYQT